MKIAVCDDEQIYLNKIHKELLELEGYAGEFKITEYLSGEELIADFSAQFIACLIVVRVKMIYTLPSSSIQPFSIDRDTLSNKRP